MLLCLDLFIFNMSHSLFSSNKQTLQIFISKLKFENVYDTREIARGLLLTKDGKLDFILKKKKKKSLKFVYCYQFLEELHKSITHHFDCQHCLWAQSVIYFNRKTCYNHNWTINKYLSSTKPEDLKRIRWQQKKNRVKRPSLRWFW